MDKYIKDLNRAVLRDQEMSRANLSDCNGYNDSAGPLHVAAIGDKFGMAQQLLDRGVDPNAVNPQGCTPLHTAAKWNAVAVAGLLVRCGVNLGAVDAASNTPLMLAASRGHADIVRLLLKADDVTSANLEHRDSFGNTALHLAAAGDHEDVVNNLMSWSANVWALNDMKETPLEVARKHNSRRVYDWLSPRAVVKDWEDTDECVELQSSANDIVLSVLQDRQSDIRDARLEQLERRTLDGKTLVHWAAIRDAAACAEHLLACGIGANATDAAGCSALHYAALNRADRVCAQLLKADADVNLQEATGLTPLMMCCKVANSEAVATRLLQTGRVKLNLADGEGETALMHAARHGGEALAMLVIPGSHVLTKNRSGLSALEISELHGHRKVTKLLEAHRPSVDAYPRHVPKNGYCLVINQVYKTPVYLSGNHQQLVLNMRKGSDCDVKRIYDVFQSQLHFRVHQKDDLTSDRMISVMKDVSTKQAGVDYFVCFILAHGMEDGVWAVDSKLVQIKDIAQLVDAEHCDDLKGKPKIFFIQACRNRVENLNNSRRLQIATEQHQQQHQQQHEQQVEEPKKTLDVSKYIDFFFGFSTWEDCVSYRCQYGSLYIQKMCDVIEENYQRMDLLKMMTRVCHVVGSTPVPGKGSACYMVPNIKSALAKDVKF